MISTRSFCQTPTQLEEKKMSRWRRALAEKKNIRVGSTEINANGTVKQIFGHVFVKKKREGWWWLKGDERRKKIDW